MPYKVGERGTYGCGDGWPMLKQTKEGRWVKDMCHDTREEAVRHVRAMNINVTMEEHAQRRYQS